LPKIRCDDSAGIFVPKERISIFEQAGSISLAPGFSPVMIAGKHRGAVSTAFIRVMTGFTRLKPGTNERRSKNEMRLFRSSEG
jgi:hypothetical protein